MINSEDEEIIVIIGNMNADYTHSFLNSDFLFKTHLDGKCSADLGTSDIGGAAGNIAIAALFTNQTLGSENTKIFMAARLGIRPADPKPGIDRKEFDLIVERQNAHNVITQNLKCMYRDLNHIDLAEGQEYIGLSKSANIEHNYGRLIIKGQSAKLRNNFDQKVSFNADAMEEMKAKIRKAKKVVIDPSDLATSFIAVECINSLPENERPIVIGDYGKREWPQNPEEARKLKTVLNAIDVLFIPDDAVTEGMEPYEKNPEELFKRFKENFDIDNIIMSNGGEDICVWEKTKEYRIPVQKVNGSIFAMCAGDCRDGAFTILYDGNNLKQAIEESAHIATEFIQEPSRQALDPNYLKNKLANNPTFKRHFKSDQPSTEVIDPPKPAAFS